MLKVCFLVLILMAGILAANDNSATPVGFEPGTVEPCNSGTYVEQPSAVDYSMDETSVNPDVTPVLAGKDTYNFTVVDWSDFDWFGSYCRGLDVVTHTSECLMSPSISSDSIYFINYDDGQKYDNMPLDPSNSGWGCYPYASVNVNDFTNTNIYNSTDLGVSWTTTTNPSGASGRGMDMDYSNNLVWETSSSTGIYSFVHQASSGTYYDVSAYIPEQMSGLTVYDNGGYHLLIVNTYNSGYAYFFDLDDNLNFLGAVPYPYESTTDHSYGIAYSPSRDTFFWAFKDTNTHCYLVEMELTITASLEQTTWGEIKSTF